MELVSSIRNLEGLVADKGLMTRVPVSDQYQGDIDFGMDVCHQLGALDLGQTVCVRDRAVIALEAMEGSNETIRRAGQLSGGGFVIVKLAKPNQDLRFDVPVVGLDTLSVLEESRAAVLALEAGKTLILDKEYFIKQANDKGLCIVGVS